MAISTTRTIQIVLLSILMLQVNASGVMMELLKVESDIEYRYAVTQVTAVFRNKRNSTQQIPLKLTLPENAYVSSLTINVGGRNHTTVVAERPAFQRNGQISAHKRGQNRNRNRDKMLQKFRATTRVRGLQTVIFYLTYEQLLIRRRGSYTNTIHLGIAKKIREVDVTLRLLENESIKDLEIIQFPWKSSWMNNTRGMHSNVRMENSSAATIILRAENVSSSSNNEGSEDRRNRNNTDKVDSESDDKEDEGIFSISFDIDRRPDGGEIQILGHFFVHRFSPEGLPKLPTHTVFVLDVSGSMHDNGKLKQLKLAMRAILTNLPKEDSYEILVFSTHVASLGIFKAHPDDIETSLSRIQRLHALGGTNFNEALLKAIIDINSFHMASEGAKQVVFLTDGRPSLGERKPTQLRRNIREANIHHLPIFSLGFGHDADMRLLKQVSSDNRGFTRKIDEDSKPADQLKGFYDEIASPLMTDVEVMYLEDEVDPNSVVRQGRSTFYAGDEMVLAGQLREGVTELEPIVTGKGNEGPLQFRVSRISTPETSHHTRDNYVERLWAYLTVKDLLEMQEVVEDKNLRTEMNFRALEIAIQFQFLTKLTSLKTEDDLEKDDDDDDGEGDTFSSLAGGAGDQSQWAKSSASRHQKSNTGTVKLDHYNHFELLSEAEFAKTLPASLSTRLNTDNNNVVSSGDDDPHFVVQVSGLEMPLCFDIHGSHGQVLSLVRDQSSGITVNGLVTSALHRPKATYFTEIFIGLGRVNFTITPHNITVATVKSHRNSKVARVLRSVWPFKKMYRRGKSRRQKSKNISKSQMMRVKRETKLNLNSYQESKSLRYHKRNIYRKQYTLEQYFLRHNLVNNYNIGDRTQFSWVPKKTNQSRQSSLMEQNVLNSKLEHEHIQQRDSLFNNIKNRLKRNSFLKRFQHFIHPQFNQNSQDSREVQLHENDRKHGRNTAQPIQRQIFQNPVFHNYRHQRNDPHPHVKNVAPNINGGERNPLYSMSYIKQLQQRKMNSNIKVFSDIENIETTIANEKLIAELQPMNTTTQPSIRIFRNYSMEGTPSTKFVSTTPNTYSHSTKKKLIHPHARRIPSHQDTQIDNGNSSSISNESFPINSYDTLNHTQTPTYNIPIGNPQNIHGVKDTFVSVTAQPIINTHETKKFQAVPHPHSKVFGQEQIANDFQRLSSNESQIKSIAYTSNQKPILRGHHIHSKNSSQSNLHVHQRKVKGTKFRRKSEKTFTWRRAAGRRYDNVIVALRTRKKIEILIGDVDAHFVITRSKTRRGQEFLGFYIQERKILSPNTTGIIGQFAYKTVGTLSPPETTTRNSTDEQGYRLAVVHSEPSTMQYHVSEVSGLVSKRRSMLHKEHVDCLFIPHQGRGLVAGTPEDYLLPCLTC